MGLLPTDPQRQKKILIGLLPLVGAFLFYQFVHVKRAADLDDMADHLENLESMNAVRRAQAARGGPALQKKLALYEEHIKRLEQLIPAREDVPELLHSVSQQAQETGVEFTGMTAPDEEPGEFYTKQTYDMSVKGSYHKVGQFMAAVGSLPRIVTPTELKLEVGKNKETDRSGDPVLQASFHIVTYVLPGPAPAPADTTGGPHVAT